MNYFNAIIIAFSSLICASFVQGQYFEDSSKGLADMVNIRNPRQSSERNREIDILREQEQRRRKAMEQYTLKPDPAGVNVSPTRPPLARCARLWDATYFKGRTLDFQSNEKRSNLWMSYFLPQSVQVDSGCSLTIFGDYGKSHVLAKDSQWLWWNQRLSAACCECQGCEGESATKDLQCARFFEFESCNSCLGYRLDLKHGDKVKSFGHLDNRMSSVAIRPGCEVTIYSDKDFKGWRYKFPWSTNLLGDNWNQQISSAECFCSNDTKPVTPYPTTTTTTTSTIVTPSTTYRPSSTPSTTYRPSSTTTPKTTSTTENDSWESTEEITTTTTPKPTTTTSKPTTTTTTTSTTENDYWESSEEKDIITTSTTSKPTTTTENEIYDTRPGSYEHVEEEDKKSDEDNDETDEDDDDDDDDDWDTEEVTEDLTTTSTTPKPVTTTTTRSTTTRPTTVRTTTEAEDEDDWGDDW